ncbi:uncharacterized protein JCM15063_003539 [Sporobolomyces koalae]|uniref:uncharacterized protein n=1 Tax=Sporobolomyces koalae TaxID=500713 RepID=UPI00316DCF83
MAFPGLSQKIKQQYAKALKAGNVHFTESEVIELDDESTQIPFEVRFAPALAKKPTKENQSEAVAPTDPFAPPYQDDLFVAEDTLREDDNNAGEAFAVLLNKFCVTPRHFLLVTKDFVKQTTPLSPLEVFAAHSILKQLGTREKHLAFFNCGPESGASQPHKHLQFIPLSNGVAPFDAFIDSNRPQDPRACFQLPLPYANFTALLDPPSATSEVAAYLGNRFLQLLDLMIDHLRRLAENSPDLFSGPIRLSNLSYNVIITTSYLHLVPRLHEKYTTPQGRHISINSLGFAGMILVKEQEALEDVQKVGVLAVLKQVGYRPVTEGDTTEAERIDGHTIDAETLKEQDKENHKPQ